MNPYDENCATSTATTAERYHGAMVAAEAWFRAHPLAGKACMLLTALTAIGALYCYARLLYHDIRETIRLWRGK